MRSVVGYIFVYNLRRNTNGALNASMRVVVHQKRVIPVGDDNCLKRVSRQGKVKVLCDSISSGIAVSFACKLQRKIKYFERPIQRFWFIDCWTNILLIYLLNYRKHINQSRTENIQPGRKTDIKKTHSDVQSAWNTQTSASEQTTGIHWPRWLRNFVLSG